MILRDYHVHTSYCDGKNPPEEIVQKAIEMGMSEIGFSGHSYVNFDIDFCMSLEDTQNYINDINYLKSKYKHQIKILCGIEYDYYSNINTDPFDYIIGSVHYLKVNDGYISVDDTPKKLEEAVRKYYNGDFLSLAEDYFNKVSDIVDKTKCDIIGHFDLITKFNQNGCFFDVCSERYVSSWKKAINKLLPKNKPFEINTGAISRGYTTFPYPSKEIIDYIIENNGKFILSSDSHNKDTLCFKFDDCIDLAKNNLL